VALHCNCKGLTSRKDLWVVLHCNHKGIAVELLLLLLLLFLGSTSCYYIVGGAHSGSLNTWADPFLDLYPLQPYMSLKIHGHVIGGDLLYHPWGRQTVPLRIPVVRKPLAFRVTSMSQTYSLWVSLSSWTAGGTPLGLLCHMVSVLWISSGASVSKTKGGSSLSSFLWWPLRPF
jgi:hypothetical protein